MNSFGKLMLVIAAVAGIGGAFYFWHDRAMPEPQPSPVPVQTITVAPSPTLEPAPSPSPTIRYPVPQGADSDSTEAKSIPSIDQSDETFEKALNGLLGSDRVAALFNLKDVIRRIVVTVDGATAHKEPAMEAWPLKPIVKEFSVGKTSDQFDMIGSENYARYHPYVALIQSMDAKKAVAAYVRYYSLFQTAHLELGEAGYFNDRLIDAIDSALKTPEVTGPIKLTRVTVRSKYKFADDQLEQLPAVQKALIRMGTENAHLIQAKLKKIREQLVKAKLEP